jgi:hypothetical protein
MGRSPSFRVYCRRLNALFRLGFPSPSCRKHLSLPPTITPGPIMQKVRRHPTWRLRQLCRQPVSDTFNSPNRGTFHHSLTVLFAIGRQVVFSLTPWSAWIHTGFHVSRATQDTPRLTQNFGYGSFTLSAGTFQILFLFIVMPCRSPTTPPG